MTGYELLGNLDTSKLVDWCKKQGVETGFDSKAFNEAVSMAEKIFG
jgi:hypothetical protein